MGRHANPDGVRDEDTFMTTADTDGDHKTYKAFFSDMGVTWPEGSELKDLAAIGEIEITNTQENIERLHNILVMANLTPCMIDIRVDFVEYDLNDIDKLARDDNISNESLQALWKKGAARLLSSGRTLTKNGQEAVVRGVTEYIYPTEFEVRPKLALNKKMRDQTTATVEPQNFEMREVGNILQVVPELDVYGNQITLLTNPQHVSAPQWKNYSIPDGYKRYQKNRWRFIMYAVTVSPKFQVVIPRPVRDSLKLMAGQKMQVI